jgi:uncharacterized protein (DUF488 family)
MNHKTSPKEMPNTIVYTIGHSNHKFTKLIELLQRNSIQLVVDVRSRPQSRWAPWFNRRNLETTLPKSGIEYQWRGDTLGGLPNNPTLYKPHPNPRRKTDPKTVADYDKIARQEWFQKAIDELLKVASRQTTAIMCAEENPHQCHRSQLIGRALVKRGVDVRHIRKNGVTEPQDGG